MALSRLAGRRPKELIGTFPNLLRRVESREEGFYMKKDMARRVLLDIGMVSGAVCLVFSF